MKKLLLMCVMFFYASIMAQTTVTIGSGASTSTAGTNGDPIYRSSGTSAYHYSRSVQLLTASDLSAVSIFPGAVINSIGYYKTTTFNVSGSNAWTVNVYLKNSSSTALSSGTAWNTMIGGATLFYSTTINSTNNFPSTAGWVTFGNNTSNTFSYTGGSIEVYIDWVPSGTLASPFTGGGFQWKYDTATSAKAMGNSDSVVIPGTSTTYSTQNRSYQTQITYTSSACSGTPNPGNTLATATSTTCSSPYSTTLSLQNITTGTGVSYQWYNNSGAISGATGMTYNTLVTAADSFYCAVTCSASGVTTNSTPVAVSGPVAANSTFPWTENFDSMTAIGSGVAPACWSISAGSSTWTSSNGASQNYNDPRSAPNYMTLYYGSSAGYLWTPSFQLTAGQSYDFSFYYIGDGYSGWTGDVVQNSSPSATGATAIGASFVTSTTVTSGTSYTQVKRTFIPASSGIYYFGIKVSSNSTPYFLGVDDFSLMPTPSCIEPTALSVSGVTSTGATVSWTAPAMAPVNGYELYYSTANTAPTAGTTPSLTGITGVSQALSSLSPATTYYVWVRSKCSLTDQSVWSNILSFVTPCVATNVPYALDFEGVTVPSLPGCSSGVNAGTGNNWVSASAPTDCPGFTTKVLKYGYSSSSAANAWFFTQGINLTGGTQYTITYKYGNNDTSYTEKLKVAYGNSAAVAAMTNVLADYPSINDKVAHSASVNFTPATSGTYYFGFNAYSATNQYNLYLDDINITATAVLATSEINDIAKNNIKVYPNPFSEVLNISDASNVKNVLITDVSGRLLKTIANPGKELHLGDLKQGMYLVTLEMKDGSKQTIKAIKK